ncbi:MAG TPA: hypothetical protein VLH56_19485 [Dissulfurispiraceae bacterium]|nr:hypothetical protein [Dissulfurispiraceae bacterium]
MANVKDLEIAVSEAMVLENAELRAKVANQRLQLQAMQRAMLRRNATIRHLRDDGIYMRSLCDCLHAEHNQTLAELRSTNARLYKRGFFARLFGSGAC